MRIIVEIEGGIARVFADDPNAIEVRVVDYDVADADDAYELIWPSGYGIRATRLAYVDIDCDGQIDDAYWDIIENRKKA